MSVRSGIDCATVDELAAAYGLGAVSRDEELAIAAHLETCDRPHAEARELIETAGLVPDALEPAAPSPGLRDRLMATVAATPQEHRPSAEAARPVQVAPPVDVVEERRPWWRMGALPAAVAAVAVAVAVGLGAYGLSLQRQLADRDAALEAVASADAVHPAEGEIGRGWVIESGDQATFIAENLAELDAGQLYELWLLDATGNAVPAGTLTETEGIILVPLERALGDAATFAITVETERVERPSGDPVMVAPLEG
jgi:anti-sigma factor RsiW